MLCAAHVELVVVDEPEGVVAVWATAVAAKRARVARDFILTELESLAEGLSI
jgi:hypothetical protein